jgi:hypothetical protein
MNSTATGDVEASGFSFPYGPKTRVKVESAALSARGNRLNVSSAILDWRDNRLAVKGTVDATSNVFQLDMDVSAKDFRWQKPENGRKEGNGEKSTEQAAHEPGVPFQGQLRFNAESFTYDKLTWTALRADVSVLPGETNVTVTNANLCGIPTPGSLKISSKGTQTEVKLAAQNQDLDSTLTCLWNKHGFMNGTYSLDGEVTSDGVAGETLRSFRGNGLEFLAKDGRIYRMGVITKIFAVLNFTEIYRGQVPDLVDEGFAYDTIKAKGVFENGKLVVDNLILEAPSMKMVWKGEMDPEKRTVDFTVLVAPLKTVDKIISHVPLLGHVLGDSLISIPVKVSGDMADPDVVPLSPSAVGSELLGYMIRTFQMPIKVIEPLWK